MRNFENVLDRFLFNNYEKLGSRRPSATVELPEAILVAINERI